MQLSKESISLLNTLHSLEYSVSVNYMQSANFLAIRNYPSLSAYFRVESDEEWGHSLKIQDYMVTRGELPSLSGQLNLQDFVNRTQFKLGNNSDEKLESSGKKIWMLNNQSVDDKVLNIFQTAYNLEQATYVAYQEGIEQARRIKDNGLIEFLQGMIDQQLDNSFTARIMLQRAKDQNEDNGLIQRWEEQMRPVVKKSAQDAAAATLLKISKDSINFN